MLGNIFTIGVVAALSGCAKAAPQTVGGVVSIPLEYTYYITPNFTGNASEAWIATKTNNQTLAGLLQQAQNATFISYDEEFSQMIGSNPEAVLVQERNVSFAFEVGIRGSHPPQQTTTDRSIPRALPSTGGETSSGSLVVSSTTSQPRSIAITLRTILSMRSRPRLSTRTEHITLTAMSTLSISAVLASNLASPV
jgi:hypothetical protein